MALFTDTTTVDDIINHVGHIDHCTDLCDVANNVLCRYTAYLQTEIRARDLAIEHLTKSFNVSIEQLTTPVVRHDVCTNTDDLVTQINTCESESDNSDTIITNECHEIPQSTTKSQNGDWPDISPSELDFIDPSQESDLLKDIIDECKFKNCGEIEDSGVDLCMYDYENIPDFLTPVVNKVINLRQKGKNKSPCSWKVGICRQKAGTKYYFSFRDHDATISAQENVSCIVIGTQSTVDLKCIHKVHERKRTYVIKPRTLVSMSPETQNLWDMATSTERILDESEMSYSIIVKSVDNLNRTSTVILSDSLTREVKFGDVKGESLGPRVRGENITCYTVKDMPSVTTLMGYNNIIIALGINDIVRNDTNPETLINMVENKCDLLLRLNPTCRIYLSTVLPTSDFIVNETIKLYNNYLLLLSQKHHNLFIIDNYCEFLSPDEKLNKMYKNRANDMIHINHRGLLKLVINIKDAILRRTLATQPHMQYSKALTSYSLP